jgi:hypothetical protein
MIGGSIDIQGLSGKASNGSLSQVPQGTNSVYAQYDHGKFYFALEAKRRPVQSTTTVTATVPVLLNGVMVLTNRTTVTHTALDRRDGYIMAAYRILPKLQVGGYFSREFRENTNPATPADYFNEWVVSGRYDFNSYFYFKMEEHFDRGTGEALYTATNPSGYQTKGDLFAAKLGFTF